MHSQNRKIEDLSAENETFRKYYVRNMADNTAEHNTEIEQVFHDFGKAVKTRENFIDREIDNLKGVVDEYLKVENRFKPRKVMKLTDSGS